MTPGWILDVLAALMLAVAAVSAARLAVTRPAGDRPVLAWPARPAAAGQHADSDIGHLLMAIAMAGALAPSLATAANGAWAVVFTVLTAWFAGQVGRAVRTSGLRGLGGGQCATSLVHAAAMLYMSLTVAGRAAAGSAMGGGMGAGGLGGGRPFLAYPTVAFALALILVGYAIWDLDQLSARRHRPAGPAAGRSPEVLASGSSAAVAAAQAPPLQAAAVRAALLSPALAVACRVVMGVTMAFMLVIML